MTDTQDQTLEEIIVAIAREWNGDDGPGGKHIRTLCDALNLCRQQRNTWCDLAFGDKEHQGSILEDDQALKVILTGDADGE